MDRFTRTRISARYSRYRHNTLDLHVLENLRSSQALYLPPSSLLQLSIKASLDPLCMHGGQGWPVMPLVSCQHEAMAAPTYLRLRRKPAGHGPRPLYLIFLCTELARGREGINRGQSSNTWKQQQQLDYIFF